MKTINWNNKARKQMKRIPRNYQDAIFNAVDMLAEFPNCEELKVKSLKNHKYDYRLRVGRYRVLFNDQSEVEIIAIMEVKKRDERTY